MKTKRVVIVADLHCGHRAGLTPFDWQYPTDVADATTRQYAEQQRYIWDFYGRELQALQPIHLLVCNGDAIDGKGPKAGGSEHITVDRVEQAAMAVIALKQAQAKKIMMVYGTPYHTGAGEDWERVVAKDLGADISGHEWVNVNGLVFDFKHQVSGSVVPYGRNTAINRELVWNTLWAKRGSQPEADVIVRSHVHYHTSSTEPGKLMIVTPALLGYGSKYGIRQCSGIVDVGFVVFDVKSKKEYTWKPHLLDMRAFGPEAKSL